MDAGLACQYHAVHGAGMVSECAIPLLSHRLNATAKL